MNLPQEHPVQPRRRLLICPAFAALTMACVLIAGACSKKEEPKPEVKAQAEPTLSASPVVAASAPVESVPQKAPPVVTPGHMPPNPRMPSGSMLSSDAAARHQLTVTQPQVQTPPPEAPVEQSIAPTAPVPVTTVHTPEDSNQARRRALEEMFRLRGQKGAAPTASKSEENPALPKNQP